MKRQPPRLASMVLRLRFSRATCEFLLGDLMEEFAEEGRTNGWYWRQVVESFVDEAGEAGKSCGKCDGWGNAGVVRERSAIRRARDAGEPGIDGGGDPGGGAGRGSEYGDFHIVERVALRPLPVRGARSMVSVYQTFRGSKDRNVNGDVSYFSFPEYENYRRNNHVFSGVVAYYPFFRATMAASGHGRWTARLRRATTSMCCRRGRRWGAGFCHPIARRRGRARWWW